MKDARASREKQRPLNSFLMEAEDSKKARTTKAPRYSERARAEYLGRRSLTYIFKRCAAFLMIDRCRRFRACPFVLQSKLRRRKRKIRPACIADQLRLLVSVRKHWPDARITANANFFPGAPGTTVFDLARLTTAIETTTAVVLAKVHVSWPH